MEMAACPPSRELATLLSSPLLLELMDLSDEAIIVLDRERRVIAVNRAFSALAGYSERELLTKGFSSLVEAGERRRLACFIAEAKERRACEASFLTRGGKAVAVGLSISPLGLEEAKPGAPRAAAFLLVGRIRGLGRLAKEADPSNGLAARILEGLADPVFIVDGPSRTVVDCNEAAVSLLGYDRAELVGRRLFDYSERQEDRERYRALLKRADESYAKTGIFQERIEVERKSGRPLPCDCIGLPFFRSDHTLGLKVFILFDRSREEARRERLADFLSRVSDLAVELAEAGVRGTGAQRAKRLSDLGFTRRQIEIARFVVQGASTKEIAFQLGIGESTVKNHVALICHKLGAKTRIGFVRILTDEQIRIC
jgi:PAS domain S-box-containing protein